MRSILCLFLLTLLSNTLAYIVTVDSHAEECFFDHATAGSKLGKKVKIEKYFAGK